MNPSPPEEASPEEVTVALATFIDRVVDSSHDRVRKLDELDQEKGQKGEPVNIDGSWGDVNRALSNLKERSEKLSSCISDQDDRFELAELRDALEKSTDGIINVMPTVATSKQLLSRMIIRYGQGLQLTMDQKKFLSPDVKSELKKLDSDIKYLLED